MFLLTLHLSLGLPSYLCCADTYMIIFFNSTDALDDNLRLTVTREDGLGPPEHGVCLPVPDAGHHLVPPPIMGHQPAGAAVDDAVADAPVPTHR